MRLKLLLVGGLLVVAVAVCFVVIWEGLHGGPGPMAGAGSLPSASAPPAPPWPSPPPNTMVNDSLPKYDPKVMEEQLKQVGEELEKNLKGQVLYNPPSAMVIDEADRIEVRIAPGDFTGDIRAGLVGRGVPAIEAIGVSAIMRVRLRGVAFKVDPANGEAQAILPGRVTQWSFDVTPIMSGKQTLDLEVSYLIKAGDTSYPSTLPPFRREIEINVGTWHAVMIGLKEHRELAISTAIGVTLGLSGFFLKLWFMERRARRFHAGETVLAAPVRRQRRRRRH